jgi:3',5'-cyclic AMP phosphodiesterase CpdA
VSQTIPYRTGRIAILSDLHLDSYARTGQDCMISRGLEDVLDGSLDALIVAGDLTNGPAGRWLQAISAQRLNAPKRSGGPSQLQIFILRTP